MASVSSGVHEAGKTIDKTEALFSQERDPRFAEMYTGISGCMTHTLTHTLILCLCKQLFFNPLLPLFCVV